MTANDTEKFAARTFDGTEYYALPTALGYAEALLRSIPPEKRHSALLALNQMRELGKAEGAKEAGKPGESIPKAMQNEIKAVYNRLEQILGTDERSPAFDEDRLTVRDIANEKIDGNDFPSDVLTVLPEELAANVLTDATSSETAKAIDRVRFALEDDLKTAIGSEDRGSVAELINDPEAVKHVPEEVQILVQKIRFLASLGQTVLHH